MELAQHQNIIAADLHRFRVICIGRRGGKTTLAVEEIKGKALAKPARIAYIAPTYSQARDIAWEMLRRELGPIIKSVNESRLEIRTHTLQEGESYIVLHGWESIETLRGQAFDFIVIDEVAMMRNFWSNWQEVIRPTLTDTKGEVMFISTPKGFNHFYDLYNLALTDTDYSSHHFTTYDNPFIPKEEIDKAKAELTEDRFAQEYLADFRKTEGLVYKEFSREQHLFGDDVKPARRESIAGLDFGYTNPTAIPFITVDLENNYWVTDEWYHSGKTDAEVGDYVAQCKFNRVFPDPENPAAIEELRRRGVNVREVVKSKDSIKAGIQLIRELLKSNRLHIHKKCVNLIAEFESYSYADKKDGKNEDELPIKENDHMLDALRYALMSVETSRPQVATVDYPTTPSYAPVYHVDGNHPIQQPRSPGPYRPSPRF